MDHAFYDAGGRAVCTAGRLGPADLYGLLKNCWNRETCAPRMRSGWTEENPTLGQCSITAFLTQDLLGGEVLGLPLGDGNYHCFNRVDGHLFDLTSEQFGEKQLYYGDPGAFVPQARADHFRKAEKYERYLLLRRRLMGEYVLWLRRCGYNCCQSVLIAYAEQTGLTADTLARLGACLGSGMGGMQGACGALVAAGMLRGLLLPPDIGRAERNRIAREVSEAFIRTCGAAVCRELKGLPDGPALCPCEDCLRRAADIIEGFSQSAVFPA